MIDDRLHALRQSIDERGYGILAGYVDAHLASVLVDKIKAQTSVVMEAYGLQVSDDSCKSLLALSKDLHKSPAGWVDPIHPKWRRPFGAMDKRGWIQALGSGRMFDGQDFISDGVCMQVQEVCRPVFAFLHDVAEDQMTRFNERVSVKPGGSPKLKAHIDGNRRGSYQAVICLSATSFLVFPYSHKAAFLPRTNRYYALTSKDIFRLGSELSSYETYVPANVGDVLFFVGGDFVHGSVGVAANDPTRYVAYAQFWPTADIAISEASEPVTQQKTKRSGDEDEDIEKLPTLKRRNIELSTSHLSRKELL